VADAGRPCRIVDAEACFLDADACSRTQRPASLQNVERSVGPQALGPGSNAEACFRTQRPASLQNVERSVGLQALGPKLDVGFFWTQGQGSLGEGGD